MGESIRRMFRFLHTSDLHIGKRFGKFDEDLRVPLRQARLNVVDRLAHIATENSASHILVAGDVFDTGTPEESTIRQFLEKLEAASETFWVLLPGNHDPLASETLWERLETGRPENVLLATKGRPIKLNENVILLPSPCEVKRPGEDTTRWMDEEPVIDGQIRIGLAHGAVLSFGEDGASDVISPDRATSANLDYMALGDWHGQRMINERTWYSGTPEPDRFKHEAPGQCLLVSIEKSGALPVVAPLKTEEFSWQERDCDLFTDSEIEDVISGLVPEPSSRRKTLLKLKARGRLSMAKRDELSALAGNYEPDFGFFELDADEIDIEINQEDMNLIDIAGSLRVVADELKDESEDDSLSTDQRKVAMQALRLLYSLSRDAHQ